MIIRILALMLLMTSSAQAREKVLDIQEVTSPSGITAWLVEDNTLPIISVQFAFDKAGSVLETEDKQGLARLLSNTIDEGAGDLSSEEFQKQLADNSITLNFSSSRDSFGGKLKTLSRNKDKAFDLLSLALNKPRFDAEPVERMRDANITRIKSSLSNPNWISARIFNDSVFEGHSYALNGGGTLTTLKNITPEDLRAFATTYLTKDNLFIGVAGDITKDELVQVLDRIFAPLPDTAPAYKISDFTQKNRGSKILYEQDIPQTLLTLAMPGISRQDKDFYTAQVMNYIFGAGGFGSRLMEEVREKRGLTYGIYSNNDRYNHVDLFTISTSTQNENIPEMLDVIQDTMNSLKSDIVSQEELKNTKSYLTGSLPLSFSSTSNIASILLSMQIHNRPIDYLDNYADNINAVTQEDIKRVANRILKPETMTAIMVGKPDNVTPTKIIESLPNVE